MTEADAITAHYTSGELWDRLTAALADDGVDVAAATIADLAPYDQFHGRGLEATRELVDGLTVAATDHVLDVGSGAGGPARYLADRTGCTVTGIDLTAELCDLARRLNTVTAMSDRVTIVTGSALDMPFEDGTFDGAYSMNVSMNIADRQGLYREIARVLRPGAWLALSELAQGPHDGLTFPTPWARTPAESFLLTPERTSELLEQNGFTVTEVRDRSAETAAAGARAREVVARGEKPPHRAVGLVHGTDSEAAANTGRGFRDGQLVPIEIHCRRRH